MRACGLSAGQPPYPRPSAHTSAPPGTPGRAGTATDGTPGARSGARRRGGSARPGGRAAPAGPARPASEGEPAAGGAGEAARADGLLGSGTTASSSWPGGCTTCGATSWADPVVPGPGGGDGAVPGPTETHPETAVTANPTRSRAVILVLCTRVTLRCEPAPGDPVGGEWPARVTRSARRPGTVPTGAGAPHGPRAAHPTDQRRCTALCRPCTASCASDRAQHPAPHRADRGRRHRRRTGPVGGPGRIRARWR